MDGAAPVRRVSIAAMAATLATMAAFLATDRTRWLGHAMAVIGVVALVGLNVLAPAAFVAERNLERVIDPSLVPPDGEVALDADYLASSRTTRSRPSSPPCHASRRSRPPGSGACSSSGEPSWMRSRRTTAVRLELRS